MPIRSFASALNVTAKTSPTYRGKLTTFENKLYDVPNDGLVRLSFNVPTGTKRLFIEVPHIYLYFVLIVFLKCKTRVCKVSRPFYCYSNAFIQITFIFRPIDYKLVYYFTSSYIQSM